MPPDLQPDLTQVTAWDAERAASWWQTCYVPGVCDAVLRDPDRSIAVVGAPGTGKTIALLAAQRAFAPSALVSPIDSERWFVRLPAEQAPKSALDIVSIAVCQAVQGVIAADPPRVAALSQLQGTFLRWILQKDVRPRTLDVWREQIGSSTLDAFFEPPFDDLYPDQTNPDDVRGQIGEMVHLAQGLGFARVVLTLDVPASLTTVNLGLVSQLFGWLDLWQHPRFVLKAALTPDAATACELAAQVRGRIVIRYMRWTPEKHEEIVRRHLAFWGEEQGIVLDTSVVPYTTQVARAALVDIFGELSPQSAVCLAIAMFDVLQNSGSLLDKAFAQQLLRELYSRYALLRIDLERRGVWRGRHFVPLAEQPFRAFEVLWYAKGGDSWFSLQRVAGSKENVHTLIKRIREAVEPLPKRPLYVCRAGSDTYRLEHTVGSPSPE